MASIRTLRRADGSTAYKVLWRDSEERKQTSFTTDSETEAELIKRLLDANHQSFRLANQAMAEAQSTAPTLHKVMQDYLGEMTGIETETKRRYEGMYTRHIQPVLGHVKMDHLTRTKIVAWFESIDRAPKTKKNIHAVLSAALSWAVKNGLAEVNEAVGISPPKTRVRHRGAVFLTPEEFGIIHGFVDDYYKLLVQALVNSGARFGEATAWLPEDFELLDTGHYRVRISKAWKRTPHGYRVGPPKSAASIRAAILPAKLTAPLTEHLRGLRSHHLVFPNKSGEQLTNGTFYNKVWRPALDAAQSDDLPAPLLKTPRVHDLRHTHASWLIQRCVPLPVIQARLGHESITTTVDVYGHLAVDSDMQAAAALD